MAKGIPMTTVLTPPKSKTQNRLFTVADLAELPSELPSGPVLWELDNGRLVAMPPPGDTHGGVETKFAAVLYYEGELKGLGKARCGEVAIVLWRDPDRVVGADVAFVAKSSLPIQVSKEGYLETIPDLVVEVRSKNDTIAGLMNKVRDYLKAGVRVVWVADPDKRTVTAHRAHRKPQIFSENDPLTIDEVIPGFRVAVRNFFEI